MDIRLLRNRRLCSLLLFTAYGTVIWITWRARATGLNPPSLWLDDVWVAFIVKYADLSELWLYESTMPMGFAAISQWFHGLFKDPELSLQLFPVLCSLLQIPLMGYLVSRLTGWRSLGLLAAALLAANPDLSIYAVRVKQYATDSFVAIVLLIAGLPRVGNAQPARLARFAAGSVLAFFVSYVIYEWLRGRRPFPGLAVMIGAAFAAVVALLYTLRLRDQTGDTVQEYWSFGFMPTDSIFAMIHFVADRGVRLIAGAFPRQELFLASVLAVLFSIGLIYVIWRKRYRVQGFCFVLFYVELLLASALQIYPVGGGRTDIFSYPVTIMLSCYGVLGVNFVAARRWSRKFHVVLVGLVLVAIFLVVRAIPASSYGAYEDARLVKRLVELAKDGGPVLIAWDSRYTVGYYSDWPIEKRFGPPSGGYGFLRSRTYVLGRRTGFRFPEEFLAGHSRAYYIQTHLEPKRMKFFDGVSKSFKAYGYAPTDVYEGPDARLVVWERE